MEASKKAGWKVAQAVFLILGVAIVAALIWRPPVGIDLFWNVLIPAAPALLVVAPGLWRNICPMSTASLLPRRLGLSAQRKLSRAWRARLAVLGFVGLLVLVPMRHLLFNTNGPATAAMLLIATAVAVLMGMRFDWRSGWCASLCPIHPVEKLYGARPAVTPRNARCTSCARCVAPCPDSTPGLNPMVVGKRGPERVLGHLMVGGFVGFVWGWYQVPDSSAAIGLQEVAAAYLWPLAGMAASGASYAALKAVLSQAHHKQLVRTFAAAAVIAYYWYRLPALAGFGPFPGDGMLLDLSTLLPAWFVVVSRVATTGFFLWYMVLRSASPKTWAVRPAFTRRS